MTNVEFREKLKNDHPLIYKYLLGGEKADKYTEDNMKLYKGATSVGEVAGNVAVGGFNFIKWIGHNWQIAILGVVALLVLLKD